MARFKIQFDEMMNPVLTALRILGGSGTNEEINQKVAEILEIPNDNLDILHNPEKGGLTEFEYRLMWARTYLKKYGLIENSVRGVWAITAKGSTTQSIDPKDVVRFVRKQLDKGNVEDNGFDEKPNDIAKWQEELLDVIATISPPAFERLIQRILRESGFVQVEVTGKSGDGGIDGHGILRLGGLLSFPVIFQGKRWKGSVGANQIRDFRGAMVGRAEKGIFITTGTFTKDAIKEATRDGAPVIDLVDGDHLVEKLKQFSIGVETRKIEQVVIDKEWFTNL